MEHQFFNEFKFYLDKQTGYWITTNCPKKRMHVVVWEFYNGKIPNGFHIHHRDGNKSNNEIFNLELISAREHISAHMSKERRDKAREWAEKIRPLTKKWHASKDGHEWHKKHGIEGWKTRKPVEKICDHCGKKFSVLAFQSRFCSNACKSAWRRKERVDYIDCFCQFCGQKFRKNKYAKSTTCSRSCGCKLSWSQGSRKKKK